MARTPNWSFLVAALLVTSAAYAQPPRSMVQAPPPVDPVDSGEEVAVEFIGDKEITGDEEIEVTFEEEISRADLDDIPPLPEYDYNQWLSLLPLFCVLLIMWNVRWRTPVSKRTASRRRPILTRHRFSPRKKTVYTKKKKKA